MLRFIIKHSLPRVVKTRGTSTLTAQSSTTTTTSTIHSKHERIRNVWISGFRLMLSLQQRQALYSSRIEDLSKLLEQEQSEIGSWDSTLREYFQPFHQEDRRITHTLHRSNGYELNLIDTGVQPIFTPDVQTALSVADCCVLVLSSVPEEHMVCGSITHHMDSFRMPKLIFLNHLDWNNADPWFILEKTRSILPNWHMAATQVPTGVGNGFRGLVDLVKLQTLYFHNGGIVVDEGVPSDMEPFVLEKRLELVSCLLPLDSKLDAVFRRDKSVSAADLEEAIRRATTALKFVPVLMGNASTRGMEHLVSGMIQYLPSAKHVPRHAIDLNNNEEVLLSGDPSRPLVAMTFKLGNADWQRAFTFIRVYEGTLKQGDVVINAKSGEKHKVHLLFSIHDDEDVFQAQGLERIKQAYAGQLVAAIDLKGKSPFCVSGETLVDGRQNYVMKPAELPTPSDRDLVLDKARKQYWAKLGLDEKDVKAAGNVRLESVIGAFHRYLMEQQG